MSERLGWVEDDIRDWWTRVMDPAGEATKAPAKLVAEMQEFIQEPTPEEAADVFIAMVAWFEQNGWSLAQTADRKMEINRARKWRRLPNGHFQHIEESA